MKVGWLIIFASTFYLFVVVLFWPIEKQVMTTTHRVPADGYERATVMFSDSHVAVRIPMTKALQEQGLGGVTHLSSTEGMMWRFNPAQRVTFWMHGMLIPLDFLWVQAGQIVAIDASVPAPTDPTSTDIPYLDPGVPVDGVIEVVDGYAAEHGISVGSQVQVVPAGS